MAIDIFLYIITQIVNKDQKQQRTQVGSLWGTFVSFGVDIVLCHNSLLFHFM